MELHLQHLSTDARTNRVEEEERKFISSYPQRNATQNACDTGMLAPEFRGVLFGSRITNSPPSAQNFVHGANSTFYVGPNISPPITPERGIRAEERGGSSIVNMNNSHRINPPPKFTPNQLERWKRELAFWKDIYSGIPGGKLLCSMGIHGEPELNDILMEYF